MELELLHAGQALLEQGILLNFVLPGQKEDCVDGIRRVGGLARCREHYYYLTIPEEDQIEGI